MNRLRRVFYVFRDYLGLVRFSHTLFALPFALLGAAMAVALNLREPPPVGPVYPRWTDFLGILLCMVFARSAAMAFNRLADRKIDALNPRTAGRHLPSGRLRVKSVVIFVCVCSAGFVLSTLLFLPNLVPVLFSVPVLLFLFGYSYAKRWTVAVHLWLGAALGLSPLAAWLVFRSDDLLGLAFVGPAFFDSPLWAPVFLGLAVMFWTAGFDIIYALQDADIDSRFHVFSLPGTWGLRAVMRIVGLLQGIMVVALLLIPFAFPLFGAVWYVAVALVFIMLCVERWVVVPPDVIADPVNYFLKKWSGYPVHSFDPGLDFDRINFAFFHMNWIISVGLLVFGVADLFF